ncbi:hypothetical protein QQS21_001628 [Conoideocrella luteorostrata]|uniref:Nitronate monooxygenase domain-containing protein n=1 Tax=Conoideocrella luteorostrata TaxID=1105319 RepID=A0AAJ0CZA4_9HYPO|nr:hypothetical protein QQS21_001628 [Conoideocrella luteorostrata]
MSPANLEEWFPWTKSPVICNGPMLGVATPKLATEVTKAGGIGFLPSAFDVTPSSEQLEKLVSDLTDSQTLLGSTSSGVINVGISFITGHESITQFSETVLPILEKLRPAALWLFAPDGLVKPHGTIIKAVKSLDPAPRVFVQVGNVTAAREAVRDGADVIVCQGIDAGGHQFRRGMGVVSFVPEVRDMLEGDEFGGREIGVLGAGGISDERGVAATMVLGADGVVMGTRFTVAEESSYPEFRKQIVLSTVDGGTSTFKSPFNDQVSNLSLWGPLYDGRAVVSTIHERFLKGATVQDLQKSLREDYSSEEATKLVRTWAGTGVGLVKEIKPAGEIVTEAREGAKELIRKLAGRF